MSNSEKIDLSKNGHLRYFKYDMEAARFLYRLHDNEASINATEIMMGIIMTHPMEIYIGDKIQFHSSDLLQKIFQKHWEPFIWKMHRHTYTVGWMPYTISYNEDVSDNIPSYVNIYYGSMFSLFNTKTNETTYHWRWDERFDSKSLKKNGVSKTTIENDVMYYDPNVSFFMPFEPIPQRDRTFDILLSDKRDSSFMFSQYTSPWASMLHKFKSNKLLNYSQINIEMKKVNPTFGLETIIPWKTEEFNNLVGYHEKEKEAKEKVTDFNDFYNIKNDQKKVIGDINLTETLSSKFFNEKPVRKDIDELTGGLDCDIQQNSVPSGSGGNMNSGIGDNDPIVIKNTGYSYDQVTDAIKKYTKDTKGIFHDPYIVNGKDGIKILVVSPIHRIKPMPTQNGRSDYQLLDTEYTSAIYKVYGVPPALAAGVNRLNTATEVQTSESVLGRNASIVTRRYEPFLLHLWFKAYGSRYVKFAVNGLKQKEMDDIKSFRLNEDFDMKDGDDKDNNTKENKNGKKNKKDEKNNNNNKNNINNNNKKNKNSIDKNSKVGKLIKIISEKERQNEMGILSDKIIGHIQKELNLTMQFKVVVVQSIDSIVKIAQSGLLPPEEASMLIKQKMNLVSGDVNNWDKSKQGGNTPTINPGLGNNRNNKDVTNKNNNNNSTDLSSVLSKLNKTLDKANGNSEKNDKNTKKAPENNDGSGDNDKNKKKRKRNETVDKSGDKNKKKKTK